MLDSSGVYGRMAWVGSPFGKWTQKKKESKFLQVHQRIVQQQRDFNSTINKRSIEANSITREERRSNDFKVLPTLRVELEVE
jgi:hypothetical protein